MSNVCYTPRVPAAHGCSMAFHGANAAEIAEAVINNSSMRDKLGLAGTAGYYLHAVALAPARQGEHKLTRDMTVKWSAMQTVPQERRGEINPTQKLVICLEHGIDDDPDARWEWTLRGGKLVAERMA